MRNNFSIAQCLFNEADYSAGQIQELLQQAEKDESVLARMLPEDEMDTRPVRTAVKRAAGSEFAAEVDAYSDYMELFTDSLRDLAHTEAVVGNAAVFVDEVTPSYAVSQHISGDFNLTIGLIASEQVYLKLAERYSQEEMPDMDELAIDSVEEFLNVVNGLFCIELANQKLEADLDTPHSAMNIHPCGSRQLRLRIYTAMGPFQAILSTDEFLETTNHADGPLAGLML